MNITRYAMIALGVVVLGASVPSAQAAKKKVVKKKVVRKTVKKAVAKSGVRYDDGIIIISGSGSIDVGKSRSVGTRDVTISKSQKFTPQMLDAIRAQSQKKADVKIAAAKKRNAGVGARVIATRANRVRPPAFNVADTRGSMVTVEQYRGKVLVLDFWATWCPPCKADAPRLAALYHKNKKLGLEIVGVNMDYDLLNLRPFAAHYGMTWRQYYDGKGWNNVLTRRFGVAAIPFSLVIGRDGKIVAPTGSDPGERERMVRVALAQKIE